MSDTVDKLLKTTESGIIIGTGNEADTNKAIERRLEARKLADAVMDTIPGTPERWKAIWKVWYMTDPHAAEDHRDAVLECLDARKRLIDPVYGRTRATLGIAPEEEVNKNIENRMVAIMPITLKAWLKRFDPLALNVRDKKEQRKIWRQVFTTFPFYRTTEKLDGDY